jgi:LysR family glycine cleavage system transcriptional activator
MTLISFHVIFEIIAIHMKRFHAMIPNITALRALISLSETGSITRTAEALSLTQSAVSHQMKTLQDVLGFAPIVRDGRNIRLSHQARLYVSEIAPALETLERASGTTKMRGRLRLNVSQGFAAYWLAPRLSSFTHAHPELWLHVNSGRGYADLGSQSDDLYITFAEKTQVPNHAIPLMPVDFFPVAAPSLLADQALQKRSDALDHPLLHLNDIHDWQGWLATPKSPSPDLKGGVIFQDMLVMQAAVLNGEGIALGDTLTCADALRRGDLIQAHHQARRSPRSYWLIEGRSGTSPARALFIEWLKATLAKEA